MLATKRSASSRRTWLISAASCALLLVPLLAHALATVGPSHVSFRATGPGGLKIDGVGRELGLAGDANVLTVVVPLSHLETGIGLRDEHMREKYLEVARFPEARLNVQRSALRLPSTGAPTEGKARGELALHGVRKAVAFHYRAESGAGGIHVQGKLSLNMNDYGIQVPSYLGITVKPTVDVGVEFTGKDF